MWLPGQKPFPTAAIDLLKIFQMLETHTPMKFFLGRKFYVTALNKYEVCKVLSKFYLNMQEHCHLPTKPFAQLINIAVCVLYVGLTGAYCKINFICLLEFLNIHSSMHIQISFLRKVEIFFIKNQKMHLVKSKFSA